MTQRDATLHVAHGYTLKDIHQVTGAACIADRTMALDYADKRDIAWSAIAEHLCTVEEPPHRQELVRIGWQAIYRTVRDSYRQRGYSDGNYADGEATMPRFVMFWGSTVTPSHEDRVIESMAVHQVVDVLTPTYRDALVALAVADDYMLGAARLGISYEAFVARIGTARKRILGLWHEGETPHRPRRTDRRVEVHGRELATHCGNGHEWTPDNTLTSHGMRRGKPFTRRFCRACDRERSQRRRAARR
jgi:hypothetical protein